MNISEGNITHRRIMSPEILLLFIFNIVFHIAFAGNLEYHRDELLYFSLGKHPDFGYASVPPLIGWISWLVQNIFGSSVYAVRLVPALLSGAMIWLASAVAREMGGSRYAQFLAGIGLTVSIFFMRSFSLFHPVHLEIFLWTLCIYILIRYLNTGRDNLLIYLGIVAGIILLNKYLGIILFAGLVVTVPFTHYRKIFTNRVFWKGIAIGTLIFLPNLIWQAVKGFPTFTHIDELYETQLVHMNVPLFLSEQLIMPFLGSVFTISGIIYLFSDKGAGKFRFLGWVAVFVILALMILKGKSYYTLGLFPFLIFSGAVAIDGWIRSRVFRTVIPVLLIVLTMPVVPIGIPVYDAEGLKEYFRILDQEYGVDLGRRFEDGSIHSLPQDYADMIGWEELAALTDKGWKMIDDKKSAFIYAENYGQAGAVTIIGEKYGLPEAVSFSESFLYWIPRDFQVEIRSVIYINNELGDDVRKLFSRITKIGSISDRDAREFGTTVWLCQEPVASFNYFWKERIKELDDH